MISESIKNLLPALAKAIAEMPDPKKNAKNDHFKNSYAKLGEVLECAMGPLAANGLLMTQTLAHGMHAGVVVLVTTVWHIASGEFITSELPLVLDKPTPQAQGSAITYGRRYSIKTLFGMDDVDDDGNATSAPRQAAKKAEPAAKPFDTVEFAVEAIKGCVSADELQQIRLRLKSSNFQGEDYKLAIATYTDRHKAGFAVTKE